MTEEYYQVMICLYHPIKMTFPFISMLFHELVKFPDNLVILLFYPIFLHILIFKPPVIMEKPFICHPVLRQPVPGHCILLRIIWFTHRRIKLMQPRQYLCLPPHFL